MIERDIVAEFISITEQYKRSPFGFRLRKTGCLLKLAEYNGLFYVDILNLFKIINELLGPNISEDIIKFLNKITFSELITLEHQGISETKTMTCIQFIDSAFFNKCSNWIINYSNEQKHEDLEKPIDSFFTSNDPLCTINRHEKQANSLYVNEMMPFQDFLFSNRQNPLIKNEIKYTPSNQGHRPRGKQMNMEKECLKDRPFMCEIPFCERAFKRFEHLKRHMKMHTGDKPFKCNFPSCYKTFSRSDNLHQHQKTHGAMCNSNGPIRFHNQTAGYNNYRNEN